MKRVIGLMLGVFAMAAVGCGSSAAGSCTTMGAGGGGSTCVDYGEGYTASSVMQSCVSPATYSASACTSTNRVGHCLITATSGGATASSTLSFYSPTTADIAMMACSAAGGTFTAN